jgi:hypothetical protein
MSHMWIIFYMTISLIIIYVIHQTWLYLVDMYTEKKTNRIIDNQIEHYKEMIENLSNHPIGQNDIIAIDDDRDETMSQDLETFLNTLSNT